jgi:hypothetical protein
MRGRKRANASPRWNAMGKRETDTCSFRICKMSTGYARGMSTGYARGMSAGYARGMSAGYARGSMGNSHSRGGPLGLPTGRGSASAPVGTCRGGRGRLRSAGYAAWYLVISPGGWVRIKGEMFSWLSFLSVPGCKRWYRCDCRVRKPPTTGYARPSTTGYASRQLQGTQAANCSARKLATTVHASWPLQCTQAANYRVRKRPTTGYASRQLQCTQAGHYSARKLSTAGYASCQVQGT